MQRIITYTILSGDSETSVLSFLRKKWFFQTYIDNYEACRACDPAERASSFWQDGSERGDVLRILVPEENGATDNGSGASIIRAVPL